MSFFRNAIFSLIVNRLYSFRKQTGADRFWYQCPPSHNVNVNIDVKPIQSTWSISWLFSYRPFLIINNWKSYSIP